MKTDTKEAVHQRHRQESVCRTRTSSQNCTELVKWCLGCVKEVAVVIEVFETTRARGSRHVVDVSDDVCKKDAANEKRYLSFENSS